MQREIKFRAWDTEKKEWVTDRITVGLKNEKSSPDTEKDQVASLCVFAGMNQCVIMQFTGLKDKNGKEIYEGDIIELKQWNPSRYFVDFVEGGFCFRTKDALSTDINMIQDSTGIHAEIIGNIHENPALLSNPQ